MRINKHPKPELKYCEVCDQPMIRVPHIEYDGEDGSPEPYWECVAGCDYLNEDKNYERV